MLGLRGNGRISRYEDAADEPTLRIAFGLYVIFGELAYDLFPSFFSEVEEDVLTRAYDLYERLQGGRSKFTKVKLNFLEAMFERAKRHRKPRA